MLGHEAWGLRLQSTRGDLLDLVQTYATEDHPPVFSRSDIFEQNVNALGRVVWITDLQTPQRIREEESGPQGAS